MSRKFMEKIRSGSRLFFILSVWGGLINLGALGAHPLALLPPVISNEYLVVNFQSDQGLPRDSITSINQDHKGYLWLATPPYGLTRFDGIRFEPFGGEFSLALVRGEVWQILRDRDAGMWLSTRRSELLKLSDGRLQHYALDSSPYPIGVDSIAQDGNGVVWVSMGNGKFGKLIGGKFVEVAALPAPTDGTIFAELQTDSRGDIWFCANDIYGLIKDEGVVGLTKVPGSVIRLTSSRSGGMWVYSGRELCHFPLGPTSEPDLIVPLEFLSVNEVTKMCEDAEGALWLGTLKQGLFRLMNGELQKIEGIHHNIKALNTDLEGNLWVGTDGAGLFKVSRRLFKVVGLVDGLVNVKVRSVGGDWAVPFVGGARKISAEGRLERNAGFLESVSSVCPDPAGGTWFGTGGDQVYYQGTEGVRSLKAAHRESRVWHVDRGGNVWIGGYPYGLSFLPVETRDQPRNLAPQLFGGCAVTAIAETQDGAIWVGTSLGEIHRWDGHRFETYGIQQGLSGSPIGALMTSADGTLWVGTLGGGVGSWRGDRFKFASLAEGLPDNSVSQLIEDDFGWLWLGSSQGIFRLRRSDLAAYMDGQRNALEAFKFGSSDGLDNIHCTAGFQPAVWKTPSGVLRFATSAGVVSVDPARLPINPPPPLVLDQVKVDGVTMPKGVDIQLPHDYISIQFSYAALSFTSPDKVIYRRQISGYDKNWVEVGNERTATYIRLEPGRYQFRFTARNGNGSWNDTPVVQNFEVLEAFWQTSWFRLVALMALVGLVAGVMRYIDLIRMKRELMRLEQANALERERVRIARDLHDDLGARLTQMAFATDIAAMNLTDPIATHAQLRDVSEQARQATRSLDETVWMVDPSKDSLPQLAGYCSQYAYNFFQRTPISCRQYICARLPNYPLDGELRHHLFAAYKEVLNNALKHSNANEVIVRISVHEKTLYILIRDNGKGFTPAQGEGSRNGLKNMNSRLAAIGGSCVLRSKPGRGTRVLLRINFPEFVVDFN